MNNAPRTKWEWSRGLVVAVIALAGAACQDLEVENLLQADRDRATENAGDVESFIAGGFHPPLWNGLHNITQATYLWPAASEFTATFQGGGTLLWWDDL